MKSLVLFFMVMISAAAMAQDPVEGSVTFTVKTVTTGTGFSPKHILAIWVEDESSNFVKTLKLRADKRKQYLYTWNNKSSGNTTDAITGATLSDHTTHTVSWDCTNTSKQLVPDGTYKIVTEFTSEHAQGPITIVSFTKSGDEVHVTPSDKSNFVNMDLLFTPVIDTTGNSTAIINQVTTNDLLKIYPNPAREVLNIEWNAPVSGPVELLIYDSAMRLAGVIFNQETVSGKNELTWTIDPTLAPGNYFVVFKGKSWYSSRIVTLLK